MSFGDNPNTRFVRPRTGDLFHTRACPFKGKRYVSWDYAEGFTNFELAEQLQEPGTAKPCKRCDPLNGPDKRISGGDQ